MFKNNKEDEVDFCEAYKSQILNNNSEDKESSPIISILIILFLLAMIIALSIFGYNYIMNMNSKTSGLQSSVEIISDEELKVTAEATEPIQIENKMKDKEVKKTVVKSLSELPKSKSLDVNDLADQIKIDMSKSEEKNKAHENSTNNDNKTESRYIESLAKTTKNIELDSVESKYIKDLEALTKEIDRERE